MDIQGTVSGIEVTLNDEGMVVCRANVTTADGDRIPVATTEPRIQSVLELANLIGAEAEVGYESKFGINQVRRVRLLDLLDQSPDRPSGPTVRIQ